MVRQAGQQLQSGNLQGAKQTAQQGLKNNSKAVVLWDFLGIADSELGDLPAARNAFLKGLALSPSSVPLNENFGLFLFKQDDYPAAKRYLEKAVALGSENPGVRFSLAGARLRTGQQQQALADLAALESALSGSAEYWEERGIAELQTDPAAAEQSFHRALTLKPGSTRAWNGAASAAEKQGLDEKALSLLVQARAANPNDVPTLIHFGSVCLRRDLGLDAVNALEKAHHLEPANNQALYLLARAYIAEQDWQHSFDFFMQFAQRLPQVPATYYAMGWLNVKLNRPTAARAQLEHCLALAPQMTGARYELAKLDIADNQMKAAEAELLQVLKQNPDYGEANLSMADLLLRKNNLDAAQVCVEKAIHANPKSAAAHYQLATILTRKRQLDSAQKERAIASALNADAVAASKTQLRIVLPEQLETP